MDLVQLLLQGGGGAVLGPILARLLGGKGLGDLGNVIAGIVGGVGVGQLSSMGVPAIGMLETDGVATAMDAVKNLGAGALGGGVLGGLLGIVRR